MLCESAFWCVIMSGHVFKLCVSERVLVLCVSERVFCVIMSVRVLYVEWSRLHAAMRSLYYYKNRPS